MSEKNDTARRLDPAIAHVLLRAILDVVFLLLIVFAVLIVIFLLRGGDPLFCLSDSVCDVGYVCTHPADIGIPVSWAGKCVVQPGPPLKPGESIPLPT